MTAIINSRAGSRLASDRGRLTMRSRRPAGWLSGAGRAAWLAGCCAVAFRLLMLLLRLLDLIVSRDRLITKHGGGSCRSGAFNCWQRRCDGMPTFVVEHGERLFGFRGPHFGLRESVVVGDRWAGVAVGFRCAAAIVAELAGESIIRRRRRQRRGATGRRSCCLAWLFHGG